MKRKHFRYYLKVYRLVCTIPKFYKAYEKNCKFYKDEFFPPNTTSYSGRKTCFPYNYPDCWKQFFIWAIKIASQSPVPVSLLIAIARNSSRFRHDHDGSSTSVAVSSSKVCTSDHDRLDGALFGMIVVIT